MPNITAGTSCRMEYHPDGGHSSHYTNSEGEEWTVKTKPPTFSPDGPIPFRTIPQQDPDVEASDWVVCMQGRNKIAKAAMKERNGGSKKKEGKHTPPTTK